jgi:hypothetical protein
MYLDFCLNNFQNLHRHFLKLPRKEYWLYFIEFTQYVTTRFEISGNRGKAPRLSQQDRSNYRRWADKTRERAKELWEIYDNDPDWKALHARPWDLIRDLKGKYHSPPVDSRELRLALGAAECLMLVAEEEDPRLKVLASAQNSSAHTSPDQSSDQYL